MNELVTIVGSSYFDLISTLIEELEKHYDGNEGGVCHDTTSNEEVRFKDEIEVTEQDQSVV